MAWSWASFALAEVSISPLLGMWPWKECRTGNRAGTFPCINLNSYPKLSVPHAASATNVIAIVKKIKLDEN